MKAQPTPDWSGARKGVPKEWRRRPEPRKAGIQKGRIPDFSQRMGVEGGIPSKKIKKFADCQ